MANEYQKINTLFMRDANNIIMPDKMTCPEFDYLKDCRWECTEKIDGTNIHFDVVFSFQYAENDSVEVSVNHTICGRTAKAQIPAHLYKKLEEIISRSDSRGRLVSQAFESAISKAIEAGENEFCVSIYGEGYGVKIQKGGNYIKNDVGFILFDVRVGDWWLTREACEEIAQQLNIPIVPLIGYMTIPEAIEYVKKGFKSTIAENPDYDAEGLVLKTPYGLQFRNGQRIITKIKTCDFQKYRQKYGDGPVEQIPNPNYKK